MTKNTFTTVTLAKGEMNVYDFGDIRLHAYKTNDFLCDEVFVVEKAGKAVVLEPPCFYDNIAELADYLKDMAVEGILVAYHAAGASFLPGVPRYATANAADYALNGGGRALVDKFTAAFGAAFDHGIHQITNVIEPGTLTLAGITFQITPSAEAFDVELPEIGVVYTHMLGHDCHSIVAGAAHADAMIAQLKGYIAQGCRLILTSHYTPENLKDAQTKIAYLEDVKRLAASCRDAAAFKAEMEKRYPAYSGQNYLDMTAGFLFQ
ncbi:MAG: hypothetical protein MR842_05220 [Clostridiales bacterium]|nr:hypothetical protein [Clostridiales bacterium]MDO4351310.1 hypothetical protein [Eubacteriales bacterium]MDY4009947.1 hypothetical protein [Candidatus Limiplasma sp.]